MVPVGGVTISQGSAIPTVFQWPAFIEHAKDEAVRAAAGRTKLTNPEARRWDDIAFVWTPFHVTGETENEHVAEGVLACSFKLWEGSWRVLNLVEQVF